VPHDGTSSTIQTDPETMARARHDVQVINAHPRVRMPRAPIESAVARTLAAERVASGVVNVVLVDDDALLNLNRRHLAHDYYTDVITFGLEVDPLEGEIYISVDRAREQAREHGVRLGDEVRRLAVHGALHLAGHDDATDDDRRRMSALEDRYLAL
jgi:probable rRNA maturation factor